MKILIVDDSNLNLQQAKNVIKENNINCEVELCSSGECALEKIKSGSIDIVLLDIVMPKITGIELLSMVRSNFKFKDVIILMFTSLNDKKYLQKSFELGANDYITKPIEEIEFVSRIKAAIKLKNNQNTIINALGMLEKQNDRLKQATLKLQETQNQLIQKEKLSAVGSLAAGIAHEINNPLGYLSSNYETLKKYVKVYKSTINNYKNLSGSLEVGRDNIKLHEIMEKINAEENSNDLNFINEDIEELLKDSKDGIDRVSKIVKGLLKFSRIDLDEGVSYNNLNDIIDEVLLILGYDYKTYVNIERNVVYDEEVSCDRSEISQVFFNIIINAIQAIKSQNRSEKGNIFISIYKENNFVQCDIYDDGPGIDKNIINKIFNPFFTTKDVGSGVGLGLSIAHDIIVNKHNGEISVKSEINKGSTFMIKLPI